MNLVDFGTVSLRLRRFAVASAAGLGLLAVAQGGPPLIDAETGETILPRYMTDAERATWEANPPARGGRPRMPLSS